MNKAGYVRKMRLFLADPDKKIWNDAELEQFLEEAVKQYSKDTGAFKSEFDFYPDENGIYYYPENFAGFMIGWSSKGQEIIPTTARELFVRSCRDASKAGDAKYIFDDNNSCGQFSLYPTPPDMQNIRTVSITNDYGEILDDNYGVFVSNDYGTTHSISFFIDCGTIFYNRMGDFEEVKDYMAVISCALGLAYSVDSEFASSTVSEFWMQMYKSRTAVFERVEHNNTGKAMSGIFY